jgi:Carboxypeptidase regulatory-like domain
MSLCSRLGRLCLPALLCCSAAWGQLPFDQAQKESSAVSQWSESLELGEATSQQQLGSVSGKIVDQLGEPIPGAVVKLAREGESASRETTSDEDGQFVYVNVAPGPFRLTISSPGLSSSEFSATVHEREHFVTPLMVLIVATQVTEVHVGLTPMELADVQVQEQMKQRVLGFIPNFYVSYVPNAAPLTTKHKFELAWRSAIDPFTFVGVGALAGLNQAGDVWSGYGQGAQGYAKRYGATYADVFTGTFIGGAILPSLLKQDPRYFYRGQGSKKSRLLYALANAVICKDDNGHWQPNYSSIGGNLAAGGIANLYLPPGDRHGFGSVVSTAVIRLGEMAIANVFQEFLIPKLTPNLPSRASASSQP